MKVADFNFDLPNALIARYPLQERTASRLLVLDGVTGSVSHKQFTDIIDCLQAGDLLVFNNTKVIPARLFGQKATGGKVELLVERLLDSHSVLAHVRASRAPQQGSVLMFNDQVQATLEARHDTLFELVFNAPVLEVLAQIGHVPLPPYIDREDELADKTRYQTVFAQYEGAVAAPTAGLHFDEALLQRIKDKDIEISFVTLHVGAGTFQPVRVETIEAHHMHKEWLEVTPEVVAAVQACKRRGGRVVAVGTTSVRSLETAALSGELKPFQGDTDIFLYPSKPFHVVDALITNFHLPESTLLMLVAAFVGYEPIMRAYKEAVAQQYRFFSYGDAMFITHNPLL